LSFCRITNGLLFRISVQRSLQQQTGSLWKAKVIPYDFVQKLKRTSQKRVCQPISCIWRWTKWNSISVGDDAHNKQPLHSALLPSHFKLSRWIPLNFTWSLLYCECCAHNQNVEVQLDSLVFGVPKVSCLIIAMSHF